jgi:hypothetical protein
MTAGKSKGQSQRCVTCCASLLFPRFLPRSPSPKRRALYEAHCASCHDEPAGRVPPVSALHAMDAGSIMRALDTGLMKAQAAVSRASRSTLSSPISRLLFKTGASASSHCILQCRIAAAAKWLTLECLGRN